MVHPFKTLVHNTTLDVIQVLRKVNYCKNWSPNNNLYICRNFAFEHSFYHG